MHVSYSEIIPHISLLSENQAHRRMKGDSEWDGVTAKVAGTEITWKDMRVMSYIAVIVDDPACPVASQVRQCRGSTMMLLGS